MKRKFTHVINSSNTDQVATGVTALTDDASVQTAPKPVKRRFQPPAFINVLRRAAKASPQPAQTASASKAAGGNGSSTSIMEAQYYTVLYTKRAANKVCCQFNRLTLLTLQPLYAYVHNSASVQKKKNKSYQDGVLEVKEGNACTLFDEVGAVA